MPALTTVHIPRDEIGRDLRLPHGGEGAAPHEFVIEPELVVRDSTGPAELPADDDLNADLAMSARTSSHARVVAD